MHAGGLSFIDSTLLLVPRLWEGDLILTLLLLGGQITLLLPSKSRSHFSFWVWTCDPSGRFLLLLDQTEEHLLPDKHPRREKGQMFTEMFPAIVSTNALWLCMLLCCLLLCPCPIYTLCFLRYLLLYNRRLWRVPPRFSGMSVHLTSLGWGLVTSPALSAT